MTVRFFNNVTALLASSITNTDTSIPLAAGSGAKFPLGVGDWCWATLATTLGNYEIVKVTGVTGDTLTVVRGQEGTAPRPFDAGDKIEVRLTAQGISDIKQEAIDTAPVQSVAGRTGDVALAIADVSGLQTALDGKQASGSYEPSITKSLGYAKWNGSAWVFVNETYSLSSHDHSGIYQPLDGDLSSIAGLAGTTGLLRKTAANTWTLDTAAYLTAETDPVFTASPAAGVTAQKITNWDAAYGWGDHALAGYLLSSTATTTYQPLDADLTAIAGIASTTGLLRKTAANTWSLDTNTYLTSFTETDPVFSASAAAGVTTQKITNWDAAHGWGDHASAGYLTSATAASTYQPLDGDLTSIAGLAGTTGFLKKTAANTWSLDTATYITGNQTIALSGDASGSGATAITVTLANSGVTAGTYNNVATEVRPFTVDAKGRITAMGTAVTIAPAWASITGKPTTISGYGITDAQPLDADLTSIAGLAGTSGLLRKTAANTWSLETATYLTANQTITFSGDATGSGTTAVTLTLANSGATAGTYNNVTVDAKGRVTAGSNVAYLTGITSGQVTTALGFTPENSANKGAANGYASLDAGGKVPSSQLPAFVDEVTEYTNLAAFPATGSAGQLYVAQDTNKVYRWSGSAYTEISPSPGSTDAVPEGSTNLYFTTARARASISATQNLTYDSGTGVITGPDLSGYLLSATAASTYQAADADLTAIAGLAGTSGFLKKTAANSWSLDTSTYLTGNQSITLSGDASGSGSTAIAVTLASSGVTAGTYNDSATAVRPFTVDAKGRVTGIGTAVTITPAWSSITSKPTTLAGYGITDAQALDADLTAIAGLAGTSGLLRKTAADTWSLDTASYLTANQSITLSGDVSGSGSTAISVTLATVTAAKGGTGQTSYTLGDLLYASGASALSKLAGNTTAAKQFLSQTGTGTVSAAPAWSAVTKSDVGLANVENTALSTWAGTTNITTLGTISSGTWSASTIAVARGGTGATDAATARTNLGVAIGSNVQAWDADLDAIAALAGTSGFLKKTAANTWSLDTATYLTGNQTITVSGDASGSGTTAISLTLANSGVTAGSYTNASITVDAKGRVTAASSGSASGVTSFNTRTGAVTLSSSDVTTALGYTPYNSTNPNGYTTNTGTVTSVALSLPSMFSVSGSPVTTSGTLTASLASQTANYVFAAPNGTAGAPTFRALVSADLPTYTGTLTSSQVTTALGYTPYNSTNPNGYTSNTGTVTSVGLSLPSIFSVTGSPVTGSGTLTASLASQTANLVFASPNGASGAPTFRALVAADIPTLNQNTTGSAATLTTGRTIGMTGDVTWTSGSFNGSANVTGTSTLANSGVTAGTYTNATITVDAKGRVTSASSGSGGGVTSFNTRTGAVTLSSSDVTTALGYTPYNSTNPSGYITTILSGASSSYASGIKFMNSGYAHYSTGTKGAAFVIADTSADTTLWPAGTADRFTVTSTGVTSSGNVTAYSDETLKKDWADLPSDFLARLAKVKSGTYTRIDGGLRQVGVSAQSLQKLMPEAVQEMANGLLSVSYGNAALSAAVELAKEVVSLRDRLARLEAIVEKLTS